MVHILYHKVGYSLLFAPKKLIRLNPNGIRADIIGTGLKRTQKLLKIFSASILTVFLISAAIPLKLYLIDHSNVVLLQVKLPYLDETTPEGYRISLVIQLLMSLYSGLATTM